MTADPHPEHADHQGARRHRDAHHRAIVLHTVVIPPSDTDSDGGASGTIHYIAVPKPNVTQQHTEPVNGILDFADRTLDRTVNTDWSGALRMAMIILVGTVAVILTCAAIAGACYAAHHWLGISIPPGILGLGLVGATGTGAYLTYRKRHRARGTAKNREDDHNTPNRPDLE